MTTIEKDIEKYLREIEDYLTCSKKQKEKALSEIRNSIYVYAEEKGIADINEIYDRFGTPEEIASQYLSTVEPKIIKRRILLKKVLTVILIIITIAVVSVSAVIIRDLYGIRNSTIEEIMIVGEAYTLKE